MTEEQFTELVNLYLDREISPEQLKSLKAELEVDPDRREAFAERRRLHRAMEIALNPEKEKVGHLPRGREAEDLSEFSGATRFPRWILGSGVAASLLIAVFVLPAVFRDSAESLPHSQSANAPDGNLVERDPLDAIGRSELRRFASVQEQKERIQNASLVAQMRLLGLSPELTPEEKQLHEVSLAAAHSPRRSISQAELLRQIQELRAIPETNLVKTGVSRSSSPAWSSSFQSSLASFGD
jgi:hypothetical protein